MINFCKFHGFGNDYIVFEAEELKNISTTRQDFAAKVCHRNLSIGGDGIAVLERLDGSVADYDCQIINPDGSIAGFSGNGTRCAVAYLYYKSLWNDENLKLKTLSGIKNYKFLKREDETFWFLAELGKPKFASDEIPYVSDENLNPVINQLLTINNHQITFTALNVGNPVAVIFVEDFEVFNWREIGKKLEIHPNFPEKTNVVFVKIIDDANIEVRIWERAAGETSSSGTCSIAAAVGHLLHKNQRGKVSVHAVGGTTEAVWREEDGEMMITGRADLAFCGEVDE